MTFTPERVKSLREEFGLSQYDFAQIIGADVRSVVRWEAGDSRPSGSAHEIMIALEIGLSKEPIREGLIKLATDASVIGGLGFFLLSLFETALKGKELPLRKAKNAFKKAHD